MWTQKIFLYIKCSIFTAFKMLNQWNAFSSTINGVPEKNSQYYYSYARKIRSLLSCVLMETNSISNNISEAKFPLRGLNPSLTHCNDYTVANHEMKVARMSSISSPTQWIARFCEQMGMVIQVNEPDAPLCSHSEKILCSRTDAMPHPSQALCKSKLSF